MADDYSNNVNTTGQIAIGGSKTGNFEASYDSDWFKVSLTAGTTYQFTLTGAADGGGTLGSYSNISLSVMGQQGYALASNWNISGSTLAPVVQFTPQSSGIYYVATGASGQLGTYKIKSSFPAADDYAADTTTIGTIAAEAAVSAAFQRTDDMDWFRFHADAGQITTFTAATGDGLVTPNYFYIYDSAGKSISSLQAQSGFVAGLGGDYFVGVSANGQIGAYTTTMHVVSDDYSADNTRTGNLNAGGQTSGVLEYRDDVDRFRMDVQQGQFYTISLSTKPGDSQQLTLSLTDGVGNYVSSSSSFADGTLTLRVLASGTGTYSLNVGGIYYVSTVGTAYTLKASAPEADDFGGSMGTATALELGVAVAGKVQSPDDVDMFKVSLSAGVTYRIGMALDNGASNYNFRMTDSSGYTVGQDFYSGQKFFTYTPTKTGDFYLSQAGGYGGVSAQGYTVMVDTVVDDYSANIATKGRLSVGSSTKGELEAGGGDADWYAVSLNAGGYYWFSVDGAKEGGGTLATYPYGAVMRLLDAKGAVLATSTPGFNGTSNILPYAVTTKGTYYVEVASPGGAGTYTVKARLGEVDDYGNDIAHAAAISTAAAVKGKLELTSDLDVFKFTAEAGVTYKLLLASGADGGVSVNSYTTLEVSGASNEYVPLRSVYDGLPQATRFFEASKSGDYYIKIGASAYGTTGTYVLSVASLGKDDFPASKLTTAVVEPGKPLSGTIAVADDHDWVKVQLEAGRTYVFDLQGSVSGGGSLDTSTSSAGMSLIGASGYAVAYTSSAVGGEPRLSYIAQTSGDYYLDVHGNGSKTGTYTVVATLTSGDATAPHLLSSSMQDGAVNVSPVMPKIVLSFDEIVMVGNGLTLSDGNGVALTLPSYGQSLAIGVGKTLVIDPHQNLKPGVTYTLSLPEGSVLDLAGNKLAGALSYKFTVADPVTVGTSGNDFMIGNMKMKLDGGAGVDTVYYGNSNPYNFQLVHNADGSYTMREYTETVGDTLTGVERLLFSSSGIALDIDGAGGQVYRLYQAAFNRTPDSAGLGFWMSKMDRGMTLNAVAEAFTASDEFIGRYGPSPSDAEFVNLLYQNVLHRAPEPAGNAHWLNLLAHDLTHAQALISFSESAENSAALASIIGNGFSYTPYG
ncbi:DUF4214 domain-containing protein [Duganella aceris]|uniref:DUF4214 domain-containing protein n=1 Tax=Duganella aceris TaxID=2703883 RepID=A0ABX0FG42_9BURK|nr:DUF4214 domain-containing protein [Duganella aceris]NGZ83530.1 DUF4214 domain-containing protein [Duganella aceris]